ncbi:uncharacterized protein LOC125645748 isoform X2 [Ostrea edulis]|uniref:uncharacterized protein LOC125645748 isoform X2 n=1 Tax=Ostrea edulis TaxID=37623 RepID=UPI0024AFC7AB|nr:uncharacterized protein LOC125645748 isoform X2 [Ostrea edulis]
MPMLANAFIVTTVPPTTVKSDKDIEEKCAAYMSSINEPLGEMEERVDRKADKIVEESSERIEKLEKKGEDKTIKPCNTDTVRETIAEQRECEFRVRNRIIQNLPESSKSEHEERQVEDLASVLTLLKVIEIKDKDIVETCVRIGKLDRNRTRITKVTVKSVDVIKKILKYFKIPKKNKPYENIFLRPDLTKMQTEQEFKLRVELCDRKEQGKTDIFIRGGRIIQKKKERAL